MTINEILESIRKVNSQIEELRTQTRKLKVLHSEYPDYYQALSDFADASRYLSHAYNNLVRLTDLR